MDKDYSYIEVTHTNNPLGEIERIDYKWIGKSPICSLSIRAIYLGMGKFDKEDKTLQVGPYKLKQLTQDYGMGGQWIREDYPFWRLVVFCHEMSGIFRIIYSRIIITLAVWNLAEYHNGMLPTYKDIYLVQKIAKFLTTSVKM